MTTAVSTGRRERLIALVGLLGVAALAWLWLWQESVRMAAMPMPPGEHGGMAMPSPLAAGPLLLAFLMWAIMMVGMMLPSAAPAILLYGGLVRRHRARGSVLPSVWVFAAGYIAVWTAFSAAATLLQAALQALALVSPMMIAANAWLAGGLLILAGLYQWLPFKQACLEKCRAPMQFFMVRWRSGTAGAFRMGAEHGAFCVGCCWALMLLLFVAGVMNLAWVALIALFVLAEKLLPAGARAGQFIGVALIVLGVVVAAGGYRIDSLLA